MSTSQGEQGNRDAEMNTAIRTSSSSSPIPRVVPTHVAEFLPFQETLARRDDEKQGSQHFDLLNSHGDSR